MYILLCFTSYSLRRRGNAREINIILKIWRRWLQIRAYICVVVSLWFDRRIPIHVIRIQHQLIKKKIKKHNILYRYILYVRLEYSRLTAKHTIFKNKLNFSENIFFLTPIGMSKRSAYLWCIYILIWMCMSYLLNRCT